MLRKVLQEYADVIVPEGWSDCAFLKRAVVQMLASRCDNTDAGVRLFQWLNDLIVEHRALAA
ncbi:MAG: hypothetical protein ABMA14_08290 [Hyphomonadaceae bacterium]